MYEILGKLWGVVMELTSIEIKLLQAIERNEADGTMFASVGEIVEKLVEPELEEDPKRLRQALEELRRKRFIDFEIGKGIRVTKSGCTALRAL